MGMILILLCPYLIERYLKEFDLFTSIWIALVIWAPFMILAIIYVYFWIRHDENNNETKEMLQILKDRNEIEANKQYYPLGKRNM